MLVQEVKAPPPSQTGLTQLQVHPGLTPGLTHLPGLNFPQNHHWITGNVPNLQPTRQITISPVDKPPGISTASAPGSDQLLLRNSNLLPASLHLEQVEFQHLF